MSDDEQRRELIRQVIAEYAQVPRLPTSAGEQQVADALRARLADMGLQARVEAVPATASYARPIGLLCAIGVLAAGLAAFSRPAAAVLAVLVAAAIVDDATGGRRWFRRITMPRRSAYNVIAQTGDPDAAATVVVLAHHDAAPGGVVFDQSLLRWLAHRWPGLLARIKTSPPTWLPVYGGPLIVAAGAATGLSPVLVVGAVVCAGSLAAMIDIGRRPAVPGANDNLSGVAALVAVADCLRTSPVRGTQVVLLSAGAEEALQEGIRSHARRHFAGLDRDRTWFVNLESVGSGHLALLEGEGPVWMRDYNLAFKDRAAGCAKALDIALSRGLRSRNSTDSDVPRRYGFPVATIVSLDADKLITHYHQDSDRPEHVDLRCVEDAARLTEAIIRDLARA